MGLKEAGYSCGVWENWSRGDARRFRANECKRKWDGFLGSANPVTAGTVVQMAKDRGWVPEYGRALDWDDEIGGDDYRILDGAWVEDHEISEPGEDWNPASDITRYLEALFEASENVGYVTQSWEKDGRHLPAKGCFDRTAGELLQALGKCKDGDIGAVFGDYNGKAGAWIRFNPLDGKGVKNDNVTDFRYVLVESDTLPPEKQLAIIRELELPAAAIVHSGGKSIHAVVRIEAGSYDEYRKRVDYLYDVCKKNGLPIDGQNKNPSRLSRMPGITRNGRKQFLIDTNTGMGSWKEWYDRIEELNDDLPDMISLAQIWRKMPPLDPPLIEGILRRGHKMLLAGPSKAGKSYLLIELAIAIASGSKWLSWRCAKGRVLYINLELADASCLNRFPDICNALDLPDGFTENIDIWNLRGKVIPMDKLAPKLIRRAQKCGYTAIIIDPLYKIITGDENSADQMAKFFNLFDKVASELNAAVIYCHHHSKGAQGGKRSIDRSSGSGVFGRDPDAILDLTELDLTEDAIKQQKNKAVCDIAQRWLDDWSDKPWREIVSQDNALVANKLLDAAKNILSPESYGALRELASRTETAENRAGAWRVEGTLREFETPAPVNLRFRWPVHIVDTSGVLDDVNAKDAYDPREARRRGAESTKTKHEFRRALQLDAVRTAIEELSKEGLIPTKQNVAKKIGKFDNADVDKNTVNNWIKAWKKQGEAVFETDSENGYAMYEVPF
jgi:RecA-family ATPase